MRTRALALVVAIGSVGLVACGSNGDDGATNRQAGTDSLAANTWVSQMCAVVEPQIDVLNSIIDSDEGGGGSLIDPTPPDDDPFGELPLGDDAMIAVQAVYAKLSTEIGALPPPAITNGAALTADYPAALSAASAAIRSAWQTELRTTMATNTPSVFLSLLETNTFVSVSPSAASAWQSLSNQIQQSSCWDLVWIIR